jgi:hypothetical protein
MLAMEVNDDAGCLDNRGVSDIFASMLAPTGARVTATQVTPCSPDMP